MSNAYFAPLYGGLMLPLMKRQGSQGLSLYALNHGTDSPPSELEYRSSPFMDTSPYDSVRTFEYSLGGLSNRSSGTHRTEDSLKRLRSMTDSVEVSPVSVVTKAPRIPSHSPGKRKRVSPTTFVNMSETEIPVLRLGDEGRSKLKSALSEQVRISPELKSHVDTIGKIRLASMHQLSQMAQVCGLWEYAQKLAREHQEGKSVRRTG